MLSTNLDQVKAVISITAITLAVGTDRVILQCTANRTGFGSGSTAKHSTAKLALIDQTSHRPTTAVKAVHRKELDHHRGVSSEMNALDVLDSSHELSS